MDARAANDRIAEKAKRLQFHSRVPMLCECSAPDCSAIVMISFEDYEEIRQDSEAFLTSPGHGIAGTELKKETATFTVRRAMQSGERNGSRRSA